MAIQYGRIISQNNMSGQYRNTMWQDNIAKQYGGIISQNNMAG